MDRFKEVLNDASTRARTIDKVNHLFICDVEIVEKYVDNLIAARRLQLVESRAHVAMEELETIPK